MPVSADELFAWHARRGALERLLPPWQSVRVERPGGIRDGDEVVLRLGPGPFSLRWVARHEGYDPPRSFADRQIKGPFASWVHQHRFETDESGSTLEDRVGYSLPLAPIGPRLGEPFVKRELERLFSFRHVRTRNDLLRNARFSGRPRRIAVTGATGLIGRALCGALRAGGHEVFRITRTPRGPEDIAWDPGASQIDAERLEGCDAVVHLAGESLFALRWSAEKKRAIYDSRVKGTRFLANALARLERPPGVLVSASAIGYYGDRGDQSVDEDSAAGQGFLAEVCRAWEDAAEPARQAGIRVAHPRLGVVLTATGGALAAMLPAFRACFAGRLGDGRQWFPWIALDDVLGVLCEAIHGTLEGPVNATSPRPVTNRQFTQTLARVLRRPARIPLPAPLLRGALGEMADALLLSSSLVQPARLSKNGFPFLFPELEDALAFELGRPRSIPGMTIETS